MNMQQMILLVIVLSSLAGVALLGYVDLALFGLAGFLTPIVLNRKK